MLWNLIFGAVAGLLTPIAEPIIRRALEQLALAELPVGETEFDVLSLIVMLMVVAGLLALMRVDSSAFLLLLGALLGLFGKHLVAVLRGVGRGE